MKYTNFLLAGLLALSLCVGGALLARAAQRSRRVVEVSPYMGGPIRITGVRVRGSTLPPEGAIDAERDWINDISFIVKNVSKRPVAHVEIHLLTRKVGADEASGVAGRTGIGRAAYGARPNAFGVYDETVPPIPPGGEAEVRLPAHYGKLTEFLRRAREDHQNREIPPDISHLRVFVGTVFHADDPDTHWYQHKRMIRKPGTDDFVLDPVQPAETEVPEEPQSVGAARGRGVTGGILSALRLAPMLRG